MILSAIGSSWPDLAQHYNSHNAGFSLILIIQKFKLVLTITASFFYSYSKEYVLQKAPKRELIKYDMEEIPLIGFGIILGIIILACGAINCYDWYNELIPGQESRGDREGHNRTDRNRNDRNRNDCHRNDTNNGNQNNRIQSKLRSQRFNYVSPSEQNLFEQQSQSGTFRTQPLQPEPTEPGPSQPGPSQPGPSQPGPSQAEPSQPGPSQPGPSQPEPSQPGPSQPGPSQPGPFQPGPSQPGPSQPGPSQPGPSKTGPSQPEPSQPGPPQAGPSQPRSARPRPIPDSVPSLSILSDQTKSPRDITNRNLHNISPNPPPPSYRDLFPSESSSKS